MSKQELMVPDVLGGDKIRLHWDKQNKPWVVMVDLCKALGCKNPKGSAAQFRESLREGEYINAVLCDANNHRQTVYVCTKEAMLMVIMWSRAEKAQEFTRWAVEVISTVLATGSYSAPGVQPQRRPWSERLDASWEAHMRFINHRWPGAWSILTALAAYVCWMEEELLLHHLEVKHSDRPDISVGGRYSTYRRGELGLSEPKRFAPLVCGKREVDVKVYAGEERPVFDEWYYGVYLPCHASEYLRNKFGGYSTVNACPAESAADHLCQRITGNRARLEIDQKVNCQKLAQIDRCEGGRLLVGMKPPELIGVPAQREILFPSELLD